MPRMKDLPSATEGIQPDFIPEGLGNNSTSRAHHFIRYLPSRSANPSNLIISKGYGTRKEALAARRENANLHGKERKTRYLAATNVVYKDQNESYVTLKGSITHDAIDPFNNPTDGLTH